ncbi:hypothetical protein TRFO_01340 [Tritrichomonas foetus]|uniref:Ras-GAP domain-containing protein n=1 Tax=Tritrichomonas foetus TaxID=1144522 RepID=A0A1J4KC01_9EUKA|nr:hypothetical protein TRFO_01340 [Tritrichomonas foetus]|eukprot:OHT07198.1 hypothetical protein TRFO_01340 [Tritrichomonas foetus]
MNDLFFFRHFLQKITDLLTAVQIKNIQQFNPESFLMSKCESYLQFFHESANLMPKKVCEFIIPQIEESIKEAVTNATTPEQVKYTLVLIALLRCSIEGYYGKDDILNTFHHSILFSSANDIYLIDNSLYQNLYKRYYKNLIMICSSKSSSLISTFINSFQSSLSNKSLNNINNTVKFEWIVETVCHSIVDIPKFEHFIKTINSTPIPEQFIPIIIESITTAFLNAVQSKPLSYVNFLEACVDNSEAKQLYYKIDKWGSIDQRLTSKTVLYIMQPTQMSRPVFEKSELYQIFLDLNNFEDLSQNTCLKAMLLPFTALSFTGVIPLLRSIVDSISSEIIKYILNNTQKINTLSNDLQINLKVNFSLGLLLSSPSLFNRELLSIFLNDTEYLDQFGEIVFRLSVITKFNAEQNQETYKELYSLLNVFIQNHNKSASIHRLMQGFKENPFFFRNFVLDNQDSFEKLLNMALDMLIDTTTFHGIYNEKFLVNPLETSFWAVTKKITKSLVTLMTKKLAASYVITPNTSNFAISILNFLRRTFTFRQNIEYPKEDLASIIYNLEAISYITFTINKTWARNCAKRLFKQLYSLISNSRIDVKTPKDCLKIFCKVIQSGSGDIHINFANIFRTYQVEKVDNSEDLPRGIFIAVNILMLKFEMLANSICKALYQPNSQRQQVKKETYDDIKSCIYVLFPLLRVAPSNIEYIISALISDNENAGSFCCPIIADSLSPALFKQMFLLIDSKLNSYRNSNGEISKDPYFVSTFENSLEILQKLLDPEIWVNDSSYPSILSNILKNIVSFSIEIKNPKLCQKCCSFMISLFPLSQKFDIKIEPKIRHYAGKTITNWINQSIVESSSISNYFYKALYSVLDGLRFLDCTNKKQDYAEAFENFMVYYSQIQEALQNTSAQNIFIEPALKLLIPIMKNNIDICINHTITLAFHPKIKARIFYLKALSNALTPEAYKKIINPVVKVTIFDLLFENNFELMKFLANSTPYNKSGEMASCIIEASAIKGIEMEVFEEFVKMEISNNQDSLRITLFRGNAVTPRAVSYFPKLFGNDWADNLMKSILKINHTSNNAVSFTNNEEMKTFWHSMIEEIEKAFSKMPLRLLKSIHILYHLLEGESEEIAYSMLSGYIFLRFLCPLLAKIDGLVDTSSLLMNASLRPTVSENRPQFFFMKDEVNDSFYKIQKLFKNIISMEINEINEPNPIDDAKKVTTNLCHVLWSQMPVIEKTLRETPEDYTLHPTLDKLITKLNKSGKPIRVSPSLTTISSEVPTTPFDQLLHTPLDPLLEKWFYLAPREAKDGTVVFILEMNQLKQPFTSQQLAAHIISQILSIGDEKFSVIVEFSDFNVSLLPSVNHVKKVLKIIPDDIYSSKLKTIYVTRVQNNAAHFLSKIAAHLKNLPLKFVYDLKLIYEEIGDISFSESTTEFFTQPEFTSSLMGKLSDHTIRLHQRSIQIIAKMEINQTQIITGDVILLSSIESIGPSQTSRSTSSFVIKTKYGDTFTIQSLVSIHLHKHVTSLFNRFKVVKDTTYNLFVDRSSLHSLLLILSFISMLSDRSDQELRAAALNMYNTTIDAAGLVSNIEKMHFSKDEVPFSMLQTVEVLANDLAKSNPDEVHNFLFEFVKSLSFLNPKDYANSERFIQPWLRYAAEQAITKASTLDSLAQIATKAPKRCFMQYNKNIWQNFNRVDLLDILLQKLCIFEDNSFASIFLSIAVNFQSEVTSFIISKLPDFASNQTQRQFVQLAEILNSLIVSQLFDVSFKPKLLHIISILRLNAIESVSHSVFLIFRALTNGITNDIELFSCSKSLESFVKVENEMNNPDNKDSKSTYYDYREFLINTINLAKFYKEHSSNELIELFKDDVSCGKLQSNNVINLNSFLFLSVLSDDQELISLYIEQIISNISIKTLSVISIILSTMTIPRNYLTGLLVTSLTILLYSEQTVAFDLILNIIRNIKNLSDLFSDHCTDNIGNCPNDVLNIFENSTHLPLINKPLFTLLLILFAFYCVKNFDIHEILETLNSNGEKDILLSILRYQFDSSLENEFLSLDFGEDATNLAAIVVVLYSKQPSEHMKKLLLKLLEEHIEYFTKFDYASFLVKNATQFKFIEPKLLILLAKATQLPPSSCTDQPIINTVFMDQKISCLNFDTAQMILKSLFNSHKD